MSSELLDKNRDALLPQKRKQDEGVGVGVSFRSKKRRRHDTAWCSPAASFSSRKGFVISSTGTAVDTYEIRQRGFSEGVNYAMILLQNPFPLLCYNISETVCS